MSENLQQVEGLRVIRAGVQSCLQDLGRFGGARYGLSQGGAMDLHAHCWANRLVGNNSQTAALEIAVGMASFKAESDLQLAITGADMQAEVGGVTVGKWCSFTLQSGQELKLRPARDGLRAYLAVKGGFQAEPVLGSMATVVRNGIGSLLRDGEFLATHRSGPGAAQRVPPRYIPNYRNEIVLRVIESYQVAGFCPDALAGFYREDYVVSPASDRMGVRLEGGPVTPPTDGMISEGIALGAIQIPADGQPIVLLNDRQTLGGYPKLGCVARVDLPKLAQAHPGTRVRFEPVTLERARDEWRDFCGYFKI